MLVLAVSIIAAAVFLFAGIGAFVSGDILGGIICEMLVVPLIVAGVSAAHSPQKPKHPFHDRQPPDVI